MTRRTFFACLAAVLSVGAVRRRHINWYPEVIEPLPTPVSFIGLFQVSDKIAKQYREGKMIQLLDQNL